jgi:cell division transport system permease protein
MLISDPQADRVVPPSGFTAQLTLFAAGAMAFLAVFALALALAAGRLAESWGSELAGTATIRIAAPPGESGLQTEAVLGVLQTTSGVLSARALSDAEQEALLAPWFGADLALDTLPVPRLVEMQVSQDFDPQSLRLRLAAEAPAATLDDHGRWRAPLVQAASGLRWLGWGIGVLILAVLGAIVTLAANAALAANAQVIAVLRLVGAKDDYIAGAFIRRFTKRAAIGACAGSLIGLLAVLLMPSGDGAAGLLTGLRLTGAGWLLPVLVPVLSAVIAFLATAAAARKTLRELA